MAKVSKDRRTLLPEILIEDLQNHLFLIKSIHQNDLTNGFALRNRVFTFPPESTPLFLKTDRFILKLNRLSRATQPVELVDSRGLF